MDNTYLDELVSYPAVVLQAIGEDATIVKLILNDPSVVPGSDAADSVYEKNLFDYQYVDDTPDSAMIYVCVETDMTRRSSYMMNSYSLYVTVYCHKDYMRLDPAKFSGMIGNRRDNVVRFIDKQLNGKDIFGVGPLALDSVRGVSAPENFTGREITYQIPDYAQ